MSVFTFSLQNPMNSLSGAFQPSSEPTRKFQVLQRESCIPHHDHSAIMLVCWGREPSREGLAVTGGRGDGLQPIWPVLSADTPVPGDSEKLPCTQSQGGL